MRKIIVKECFDKNILQGSPASGKNMPLDLITKIVEFRVKQNLEKEEKKKQIKRK